MIKLKIEPSEVKGFNYHPSYSYGSLEDWLLFDESVWRRELTIGKQYLPKMNTIRIWLSWNAFCRGEKRFIENIQKVIDICKELDLYIHKLTSYFLHLQTKILQTIFRCYPAKNLLELD